MVIGIENNNFYTSLTIYAFGVFTIWYGFFTFFLFLSEVALDHFIRAKIPKNRNIL